jgi:predicted dehydrogenase
LPTGLHKQATVAAAKAGKHVFCEKPMAMSLKDADAMIDACDKAKVKLMVGQVRRYDSDWGTFRKLILGNAVGRPVLWRQTSGGSGPGRWFMDAKMGGGPFLDGCVHNWDFANYIFGEPGEALGSIMRFRTTSALDTGAVIVRYKSGDEVMLCWSWGLPTGVRAGFGLEVLGPKGVIRFPGTFELPDGFDAEKYGAYQVDTGKRTRLVKFRKRNMFAEEWKDFRRCIEKDTEPQVTGETAKQALAVGLAVLKTGASRKPVKI